MSGFDLLRLAAAVLVIVHHSFVLNGQASPLLGVIDMGALAVGTFFVISGYLVTGSFQRSRDVGDYLTKRALRIFPALLLVLLLTAFLLGPLVSTAPTADYFSDPQPFLYVMRNLLLYPVNYLLPGVFDANPYPHVVNGSLWTLRLEFTCYLAVAVLGGARLLRFSVTAMLATLAGLAYLVTLALHGFGAEDNLMRLAGLAAQNGFLFMAGASLKLWNRPSPLWVVTLSAVLLATPIWVLGLPLVIIAIGRLNGPRLPADLSYGLYIYAFPLQQWLASHHQMNVFTALAATLPFAALSWWLVEKPALGLKARRQASPGRRPAGQLSCGSHRSVRSAARRP